MSYAISVIALIISGIFGKMWWDERHATRPVLPPSFIESRIKAANLVPITEQISKVYAICPKDAGFFGIGGPAKYLMSWTARVNYKIDLSKVKITEAVTEEGKEWTIEAPQIEVLNSGYNLIDEKDYYKFNNDALIAKSATALDNHYKHERERATDIALYTANWRIRNDPTLTEDMKDQLKLIFYAQISQISDQEVNFKKMKVVIAKPTTPLIKPDAPDLCESQPFKTNLGLTELSE